MPHPCVVCGRSRMNPNNREEEYMFFGFPVNYEERCKKWLEFCCREDLYKLTKKQLLQRMVCSKHFEKKEFLNDYHDRLNCTGVPSIYDPSQSLYNITCVLCRKYRKDPPGSNYDGTTFHHFPGEEFRCLKWLDFVNIDSYYRLTRKEILYCYICSNHFEESQFMPGYKARLCDNAVPTIRRPGQVNPVDRTSRMFKATNNLKLYQTPEKIKKYEPLTTAVLESQACAACGRLRSDPRNKLERYKFHPFPAYEIGRCLRWCQFLGREDLLKMSPNQIRKLVLCSKHFLSGQSFQNVGPCDAVPTIRDVNDAALTERTKLSATSEREEITDVEEAEPRGIQEPARPMVSSKKPKIDNKPTPLAKKRGRVKRSTSINIPKIDTFANNNRVRKIPIPATNWKIQFANNQFQPLTIANANSINTTITTDGKKVILPFAGNISNLGAPIPVHSLSSIPPGFLIKINLPEQQGQNKKPVKAARRQAKQKKAEGDDNGDANEPKVMRRRRAKDVDESIQRVKCESELYLEDNYGDENHEEEEAYKHKFVEHAEETVGDVIEVLENEFMDLDDSYEVKNEEIHQMESYEEVETIESEIEESATLSTKKSNKRVKRMSSRTRRTLLPIRMEIRRFLHKLKPHVSRLPRKAKAQLKLSIVNLVIDRL